MAGIVHVVLIEWREEDRPAGPEEAATLVDRHLPGIPGVVSVDRGTSVSPEGLESGFEWALVIRFADEDALHGYLPHPEHQVVGAYLREHAARLVVFDVAER